LWQTLTGLLPKPGVWTARIWLKADDLSGTSNVFQASVYNISAMDWAKTTQSGNEDALFLFTGNQLSETYAAVSIPFYWNGSDNIQLRLFRLGNDTSTILWIDRLEYRSTFSKNTGEGKAPIGAKVTVEPAAPVFINLSATLTIAAGYNAESVKATARQNVVDYIRSLSFTDDNDIRYVRIGQAILDTTGVQDYSNLLVNGSSDNVVVGTQEVAVLGTVTFT
jgi:hypothetical protein